MTAETQQKSQAAFNQGRIAKPLRGGGGQAVPPHHQPQTVQRDAQPGQPLYQALAAGSPVGRLQNEEGGGKRRELPVLFVADSRGKADEDRIMVLRVSALMTNCSKGELGRPCFILVQSRS